MKIDEAKTEVHRWFDYLERQKEKSLKIQGIASDVRNGTISQEEARKRLRHIDSSPVVHDGAKLEEALKIIMKELDKLERT